MVKMTQSRYRVWGRGKWRMTGGYLESPLLGPAVGLYPSAKALGTCVGNLRASRKG